MTRSTLKRIPRPNLERLARFVGVARPEVLPLGLLVHALLRSGVGARGLG